MKYECIFFDLDDTILDFGAAEAVAYSRALALYGIDRTDALLDRYHAINITWWEKHERGEATRDELLVERHRELFDELGIAADPAAFEADYRRFLGIGHWFVDGAEETLHALHDRGYRLFIASNGVSETQHSRLSGTGLVPLFEQIFISEELDANKPEPEYFRRCFARIPGFQIEKALLVGDSLTSDIKGAKAVGLPCCWYNPRRKPAPPELCPDFEISNLRELLQYL